MEEPLYQPDRKKELARNYDLVDMEGYAVARACEAHDIPCILLKGVTDFGDSNAKKDIKDNITPVSETVADAIIYTLEGLKTAKKRSKKLHNFQQYFYEENFEFYQNRALIFSLPLLFAGAWLASIKFPAYLFFYGLLLRD